MTGNPYEQGKLAYCAGQPSSDNPFPPIGGSSAERIRWFDGYFDARIVARLGHIFRKWNLTWCDS